MVVINNYKIKEVHIPQRLIFNNELYTITNIVDKFIIREYVIKTFNNYIDEIYLINPHPNAQPSTGKFCIPTSLRKHQINNQSSEIIKNMLRCFNLDDCYFTPWDELDYEKV